MDDRMVYIAEQIAALASVLLMGACGVQLLIRFARVLRGREAADGLARRRRFAPHSALLLAGCAGLFSRFVLYALAYAMYRAGGVGGDGFVQSFERLWAHWDTQHYVGIAQQGYTAVGDERLRLVFFPLYPMLMRLLSPLTGGDVFASGIVISLACSAASSALVYDLSYMHDGRAGARLSLGYFLLSPLSVFLGCVYTESLFICLTLLGVCLLRRGHPWLCALCGALSAFTRMPGVIIAGLLIIDFCGRIPQKKVDLRAFVSCCAQVLLVFGGLIAYFIINWQVTGDPFTYLTYQRENWYQEPGAFWRSTANTVHYFLTGVGENDWLWTWGFQLLCMLGAYLLLAFVSRRLPFDLAAYSFVYTAVVLAPTWLLSGARYLYALCAMPMLLARAPVSRRGHKLLLAGSAAMLVVWTFGYTLALEVL